MKPTTREHRQRLLSILHQLARASEPTLQRVETELGLTARNESPDAGRPWGECACGMTGPCMWDECQHPIVTRSAKYMGEADDNPNAGKPYEVTK